MDSDYNKVNIGAVVRWNHAFVFYTILHRCHLNLLDFKTDKTGQRLWLCAVVSDIISYLINSKDFSFLSLDLFGVL